MDSPPPMPWYLWVLALVMAPAVYHLAVWLSTWADPAALFGIGIGMILVGAITRR